MVTPLPTNPLAGLHGFVDPRRQMLLGLASGLVSGNNWSEGLGNGFAMAAQGKQADDAYATAKKEEADRAKQLNYTIQAFQKAGRQDLVDMANAGMMGEAWNAFNKPAKSPLEINGQLVDPETYEVLGDFRDPEQPPEPATPPSGYRYGNDGNLTFIPGGPADPVNKRGGGIPPATLQKEMFETDEGILAGENVLGALDRALELNAEGQSRAGWGSEFSATVGANLPDWAPFGIGGNDKFDSQTLELKNLVTSQALDQLKATFGAMPTEGERKILLEIQGSVDQPRDVRDKIFRRARVAAEKRLAFNRKKAEALRSGKYFEEGFTPMNVDGSSTGDAELDQLLKDYGD